MTKVENWNAFMEEVGDLIHDKKVLSMRFIQHHGDISCYEHSVFVAYVSFRMARKLGLDYKACARGGLLHDLYLYTDKSRTAIGGLQCFVHPKAALSNALGICDLTEKERNIIVSHMWPLARKAPKSREAIIVSMADKYCATTEALHIWHMMHMRRLLPA